MPETVARRMLFYCQTGDVERARMSCRQLVTQLKAKEPTGILLQSSPTVVSVMMEILLTAFNLLPDCRSPLLALPSLK